MLNTNLMINPKIAQEWLMKKNLYEFIKEMWDSYETANFIDSWLIEFMSECFMFSMKHMLPKYVWDSWIDDEEYNKLVKKYNAICPVRDKKNINGDPVLRHDWNIGPRHTKSSILNVCGPVWLVLNTPISVASVSHTRSLSTEMNEKRKKLMESDKYNYYFGHDFKNTLAVSTSTNIKMKSGAELYSVAQASFTGFGADVIIADDLISSVNAKKDMQVLRNALSFFRDTMPTRINNQKFGVIWHIQQRLARGDISGYIAKDNNLSKVYSHTELQAISDKDITFIYPCSGKIKHIKKGDFLWPERFGDYTSLKMEVGHNDFETQYNQKASESDINPIKDNMIQFINEKQYREFRLMSDVRYNSHDFAIKGKDGNDYDGFVSAYGKNNELVFDGCLEERRDFIKQKQFVSNLYNIDQTAVQVIEDKANGSPILQDMRLDIPSMVGFDPKGDSKSQRLEKAAFYLNNGLIKFVENEQTLKLIERLKEFPFVEFDDIVDAFSQLVIYHFTQRKQGIYAMSFNSTNIIDKIDRPEHENVYYTFAAFMSGDSIKVLAVDYNLKNDIFTVEKEWLLRGVQQFEEFHKENVFYNNIFIDLSIKNILNFVLNGRYNLLPFNSKDRDASVNVLRSGFYNKKVVVHNSCTGTINDISKLRMIDNSADRGQEKIDTFDEGFAGCLRAIVEYYKGDSGMWF